jgi:hypothetical protein
MVRVDDVTESLNQIVQIRCQFRLQAQSHWLCNRARVERVSYRICNIFTCVTLIRQLGVESIDSCAVVGCDAMDAYIFVCAVSDSWIKTSMAQEREKRESEWGDIENIK